MSDRGDVRHLIQPKPSSIGQDTGRTVLLVENFFWPALPCRGGTATCIGRQSYFGSYCTAVSATYWTY